MPKGSKHAVIVAVAVLILSLLSLGAVAATEVAAESDGEATSSAAQGFPTPEEAVREYLAGVAEADFDRVLGATAVDEMADGFRFDLATDRLKAFVPYSMMAPAEYPFYADMNRVMQANRVMFHVRNLTYSLLSDVDLDTVTTPADLTWAHDFTETVDPARLRALTVVDVRVADPDRLESTQMQVAQALRARTAGVDELTERVALVSFDHDLYWVGFTLGRYGDGWKVQEQVAILAGSDSSGIANPTTVEDCDELTSTE
jgi:hypothetical protein